MRLRPTTLAFALFLGLAIGAQPMTAQDTSGLIEVGQMAPDFTVIGATRYGVLEDPVRLSDFRGEAVVLAFFFRARTRG
jgi:peroxiredoxin Q/BCP